MRRKLLSILALTLMTISAWAQAPASAEAVDLNLPSGTKWANMNIGATSETDYGDYFAWGAVEPFYNTLSPIAWESGYTTGYVSESAPFWNGSAWTKYTTSDSYLEAADDAVVANWGAPWQMPTYEEYVELLTGTDQVWVANYNDTGVSGMKFINKQDATKFIFLPTGGQIDGTDFANKGEYGYYWLSSIHPSDINLAYCFYIHNTVSATSGSRYKGQTIRAIQHPNYNVMLKLGTDDASNWTISPTSGEENTLVTLTYNGTRHIKTVRAAERMINDPLLIPLTLQATGDGAITLTNAPTGMKYTKNGGAKTAAPSSISVTTGDVVQFYGNGTSITNYGTTTINCTVNCYIYGNIMSLLNETYFPTAKVLTETNVFKSLFSGNTHIINHDTKILVLPATTLSISCYDYMFYGCTGLTVAPELPAETLTANCYRYMFQGCSNLQEAPELPATTIATQCYKNMFYSCGNLTKAPDILPATTLQPSCYESMFGNCTSLTSSPILPATTLASSCYKEMFRGCSNLSEVTCLATSISAYQCTNNWLGSVKSSGTFTTPSSTGWSSGASGIPSTWTRVNYVTP